MLTITAPRTARPSTTPCPRCRGHISATRDQHGAASTASCVPGPGIQTDRCEAPGAVAGVLPQARLAHPLVAAGDYGWLEDRHVSLAPEDTPTDTEAAAAAAENEAV